MSRVTIMVLVFLCLSLAACSDDKAVDPPPPSPYKDLSAEWHVLFNLQEAYNRKNADRVDELLDADNFTFYFYPGDVGGDVPEFWDYGAEMQATTNMFSGHGGSQNNPILSIIVELFDVETTEWTDVTDHPDFPGETLRSATVGYQYFMDTQKDLQYITSGVPQAQFWVRNIDGKWKLARWLDLSTGGFAQRAPASTEETNWGQIKALYQGGGQ